MAASNATVRMRLAHAKETVPDWLSGSSTSLQNGCYYGAGLIRSAAFLRSVELGIDRISGLWFDERKLQYFNYRLSRARMVVEERIMIITDPQDLEEEKLHISQALNKCGYPTWALDKANRRKPHKCCFGTSDFDILCNQL
ncbi:hypothetical protein Bbelb_050890 [Branchiostoma belcheri]|nr:hypothetical protein Bbelb_050890 [Branchiostoma belcheri]